MSSEKSIETIEEVHQYLRDMGEVSYSYEISETLTRDHGDMFEVYLYHKKRDELTSATLVLKKNGEIIPTGTDVDVSYYIDEVRAGRWGNDRGQIDEDELLAMEENTDFDWSNTELIPDDFEIIDD